jgi:hypothetical protein
MASRKVEPHIIRRRKVSRGYIATEPNSAETLPTINPRAKSKSDATSPGRGMGNIRLKNDSVESDEKTDTGTAPSASGKPRIENRIVGLEDSNLIAR